MLYRAHAHRLQLETTLLRYDIPYEVRGGVRFFEQAHVKDVTAHLRFIENPRDEVAFQRVLLLQPGVGPATARRLWRALKAPAEPTALAERLAAPELRRLVGARARPAWESLCDTVRALLQARDDPEQAVRAVLDGGYADLAASRFTNYESRLEDLEQLALFAAQYPTVRALLEELVLLGEMYGQDVEGGGDDEEGRVVLSTIHQAKGLEWDVVFLIHLVEGALPSPRALDEEGGEEEERRIFYVAMTRARNELYLCYPIVRSGAGGTLLQQPSRFLQELPEGLLERWELSEVDAHEQPLPVVPAGGPGRRSPPRSRPERDRQPEWDPNVDPIWDDDGFA